MAGLLGYAGLGVTVFALISVIVSVAIDYWVFVSLGDEKFYVGLWRMCYEGPDFKDCTTFTDPTTATIVIRAMLLLAAVLDICAIVCGTLKLFKMKKKKALGYATAGLLVTAGICLFVGFTVFMKKIFNQAYIDKLENPDLDINLHAGFVFCIIAWLASLAGAVLFGLATVQDKD